VDDLDARGEDEGEVRRAAGMSGHVIPIRDVDRSSQLAHLSCRRLQPQTVREDPEAGLCGRTPSAVEERSSAPRR